MRILITGGTGSIGTILARKILDRTNYTVCIYSRDEQKQERMANEFAAHRNRIRFFIGDIRDKQRLALAVSDSDSIIHAAALKIVPAMEYNPIEAIKTNILGTQNLIETAIETCDLTTREHDGLPRHREKIRRVISLSTDKAVAPTNLYGATKLCLEKLCVAANNYGRACIFSAVRYGNVAMSRGSVIPRFLQMREQGRALEVTDERMTRFWISLDEASDFVLRCLWTMQGGEVFIPKMKSFRILDLAEIINPNKIEYIGKRPGEKIHETIISEDECHGAYFDAVHSRYVIGGAGGLPIGHALTSANVVMPIEDLNDLVTKELLRAPVSSSA